MSLDVVYVVVTYPEVTESSELPLPEDSSVDLQAFDDYDDAMEFLDLVPNKWADVFTLPIHAPSQAAARRRRLAEGAA